MDRLSRLRQMAAENQPAEASDAAGGAEAQIEETSLSAQPEPFMADFFNRVKRIRDNIEDIEQAIEQVAQLHTESLVAVSKEDRDRLNEKLQDTMARISALGNKIRADLKQIEKENKRAQQEGTFEDGTVSTDLRIRQSQHSSLSRKFVKVMTRYNDVQAENKRRYGENVARQCRVVEPSLSDDAIQKVIEHGTEGIFSGMRLEGAEAKLNEIRDRHKDIQQLERSLLELHEMFTDMSTLVASQGEMIDRIEFSVEQSHNYVKKATEQVVQARHYQESAR
nr:Chain B, SYNTAXIN1 [Monosiga brevicollis]